MGESREDEATSGSDAGEETSSWHSARVARRLELAATILLSVAVVCTAYCAYESTRWSGVQAIALAQASATRIESGKAQGLANQQIAYDALTFAQLAEAYTQDQTETVQFLLDRVTREEFRPYLDEWMTLRPLHNLDAPRTPFELEDFSNAAAVQASELEAEAATLFQDAQDANQTGDDYVLGTVFFAGVLFFAGVSTKLDSPKLSTFVLGLASLWLVLGATRVLTLPFH